ncbi:MAG: hypothetical protein ACRDHL_01585, partial [Candidatus Promineifilaceae bacterium]
PGSTPGATPNASPAASPSPSATAGSPAAPLAFSYQLEWSLDPNNSDLAIAHVTITASGGGGGYRYFHDDLPVSGPVFSYNWAACQPNPGSLRVDSANGDSVRVDYYELPPC